MLSYLDRAYLMILKDSSTTQKRINEELGIKDARGLIFRLKKKGTIEGTDGNYKVINPLIKFNKEVTENGLKRINNSKTIYYQSLIDAYMECFYEATTVNDMLKLGREIRLLIERL